MSQLAQDVENILGNSQEARDSDNELITQVLEQMGAAFTPYQRDLMHAVSFESITRLRRKLQEQGKYLPSPAIARQRRLKSYVVQQNAPTAKPERLQEIINGNAETLFLEEL